MLGISVSSAVAVTGLSRSTIYKLFRDGGLSRLKVRGRTFVRPEELCRLFGYSDVEYVMRLAAKTATPTPAASKVEGGGHA